MRQALAAQVDKGWSNGQAHIMPTGQFWTQTTTPSQTYTSANLGLTAATTS